MTTRRCLRAAALALVVLSATTIGSVHAAPSAADLNVGSFNIRDPDKGVPWTRRLTFIARDIKEELPDILGVQELYESDERQQFMKRLTTKVSPDYQMYPPPELGNKGHGDGYDNRIVYRSSKVKLMRSGSLRYRAQVRGDSVRWLVWGLFRHRASGRRVFFATTHLAPGSRAADNAVARREWSELIREVGRRSRKSKAYVVVVGDFNTSKFQVPANTMLARMRRAGYGDVLGQTFKSYETPTGRAVHRVDVRVNSFNDLDPVVAHHAEERGKVGNNVDWIFASNSLRVPRWRTVIHAKKGRMSQPLPSDHNMVSARITLP
jgi:endonuclease/exonuclease/phosphatase family metal-dependent hydrolase